MTPNEYDIKDMLRKSAWKPNKHMIYQIMKIVENLLYFKTFT